VLRFLLSLAVLVSTASASAPAYSADTILKAGSYTPGPFAPGSVLSLFGTGLAIAPHALTSDDIQNGQLPFELNAVRVYLDGASLPLLYVSETQINFILPYKQMPGPAVVRVARQGVSGPEVYITLVDAAPALFVDPAGYAIATHGDTSVITPEAPAKAGEIIVIYATGLGKLQKNPDSGELPNYVSSILALSTLKITVGDTAIPADKILYAGLTPMSAGLYQLNVVLPGVLGTDPELRVSIGAVSTTAGAKLAGR
jgi:uncharacterized protein (TIGR03437 family)